MSKLLVVFGITEQQGGSVANHVLKTKDLSERFRIQGVTRDTNSPQAQAFRERGVELVQAEWSDPKSLAAALKGANAVFLVTLPAGFDDKGQLRESVHGKACVDAAINAAVEFFILSTLPNIIRISNGKYSGVYNFNAKTENEEYVRTKPIRSAFVAPGRFMQNYAGKMRPTHSDTSAPYTIHDTFAPQDLIPLIDITSDTGKYVGAMLCDFHVFEGKDLAMAENLYSLEQIADALSKSSGQQVKYEQLSEAAIRPRFAPQLANIFIDAQKFQREFGFYGPDSAEQIALAKQMTKETLNSFDEFLKENEWI